MTEKRELSNEDFAALKSQFDDYESRYRSIASVEIEAGYPLVDGSEGNISDAGCIGYEGLEEYFGDELLDSVVPRIALNCLVKTEGCKWIMLKQGNEWEYGVEHALLKRPVLESELKRGEWLEVWDFDETPEPHEVALESYDDIKSMLAKKRIFRGLLKPN